MQVFWKTDVVWWVAAAVVCVSYERKGSRLLLDASELGAGKSKDNIGKIQT